MEPLGKSLRYFPPFWLSKKEMSNKWRGNLCNFMIYDYHMHVIGRFVFEGKLIQPLGGRPFPSDWPTFGIKDFG